MARNGKIARLARHIRDELNQRLDNGEPGVQLLEWLNSLPEVKQVLQSNFDSRPISKQNLHEWTRGGYHSWLRLQESREQVEVLREQSGDLEKVAGDCSIADRITTLLSVQLLAAIQQLDTIKDPKERWLQTKDLLHELHRLRREDHHATRIRLTREQWEITRERQYAQDRLTCQKRKKKRLFKWLHSLRERGDNARLLGHNWAKWYHCVQNDLPLPDDMPLPDWYFDDMNIDDEDCDSSSSSSLFAPKSGEGGSSSTSTSPVAAQSESKPVKPSQSKSAEKKKRGAPARPHSNKTKSAPSQNCEPPDAIPSTATRHLSDPVKPNQSKPEATEPSPEWGHSCPQQHSAPAAATDTNAPTSSPPDPPPSSGALPSPAEMLRAITVHQKFK